MWLGGSAAALVTQGVFRKRFARDTAWGHNDGWQREIAIWNLGTIIAGIGISASGDYPARAQLQGLMVLSILFTLNHLSAALRAPKSWSNWIGAGSEHRRAGHGIIRPMEHTNGGLTTNGWYRCRQDGTIEPWRTTRTWLSASAK
ncbi:hypothetical protein [Mycobacteroides salmoniphilum]|uniref:hypothetical protein n=1 Tax=Mycobacteroides salmoniphilum TaxID=404941 RepID=UPI0010D1E402|nr:hypothetical protein [Mycobacteroides salmoniphilum]TDZ76385.1 hypothetical protein DE4586_04292 [Mycobacteroides salmoniphilum]TDZ84903.1 hypothetical protein DE4587_03830 [Mycobacteroides salmoniphilum]